MHRFWIDPKYVNEKYLTLKDRSFHHVFRVCRFQKGQKLIFLSNQGKKYLVELEEISHRQARARILEKISLSPLKKPFIHLALSCPRFSVLESLIRKGVELGVSDFHPFVSDLSFVRKVDSIQKNRIKRWESIIQHATAQSLHPKGMNLHPVRTLKSVLNLYSKASRATALFFYEGEGERSFGEVLGSLKVDFFNEIWIFVGSEGGFSPQEVSIFKSYQMESLTLGDQILKVETACLTVLGILKYKLGQL